jgi:TetR/AcrR family transcriptional regulator, repressor for neighboring sulfatase
MARAAKKIVDPPKRSRKSPEEAQRLILQAAEELLISGGLHAVTVRSVAERVGMTDMGVNHHFGSREGLLKSLLELVATRLRKELKEFVASWLNAGAHLGALVDRLADAYKAGHTQLALALYEAGWRDRGTPVLEPVIEALHEARVRRLGKCVSIEDTRLAVAAMHQALAFEPLFGAEFRRSAGVRGRDAQDAMPQRQWWLETLALRLGIPSGTPSVRDEASRP